MALIKCPECEKEISSLAKCCPNCGCPNAQFECNFLEQENYKDNETECETIVDEISISELQKVNFEVDNTIPKKKSKAPIVLLVIFLIIMVAILTIFVIVPRVSAGQRYEKGVQYMEAGEYYDAYNQFQWAMDNVYDYKDSNSLSISCVQKLMDEKNYTDAFECITYNEEIAKHITVKEEDYADLGACIDERLVSAFSKSRYEVHQDSIACYAIAVNEVLPNDYGNVKVYINIGAAVAVSYAEFSDDEDFFISVSSLLCDTLKNNSKIDYLKRILEQDSLIKHFLSGETPERRHENYDGECISTWNATKSNHQFFIHGIGNGGWRSIGDWSSFESPENNEAEYYYIENSTSYISFEDKSREAVEQFTITINSYSNITITSCTTNKKMTMTRTDYQNI